MSRFVIECPNCGKFAEAKTGFFARKKIDCSCGYTINVRTDKLTARNARTAAMRWSLISPRAQRPSVRFATALSIPRRSRTKL